ncbi:MAG: nucleoside hydrolase [Thermoguttaceae bacterium]|nr:nucleoside hydrolase [Thermoguttaceae bacterium]
MSAERFLKILYPVFFFAAFLFMIPPVPAAEGDLLDVRDDSETPVKIIFDTDIGGDIDDTFALALIHRFCDRGKCELLGVTLTNTTLESAQFVAAVNAVNNRPEIPVGITLPTAKDDSYSSATLSQTLADGSPEYPVPEGFLPENPVRLLRRLLCDAKDHEVVIVQVGMSTNLAALLDSPADDLSPMTGYELAEKKVRLVSIMGGSFVFGDTEPSYRDISEWNIKCDIPAAQKLARMWPGRIVYSGYETGNRILMSPVNLINDYNTTPAAKILHDAFGHWTAKNTQEGFRHQRPTWDLTSVFFVVRPEDGRGYYTLSEPGTVDFTDEGLSSFQPDPNGRHQVFLTTPETRIRVQEAFVNLCSTP